MLGLQELEEAEIELEMLRDERTVRGGDVAAAPANVVGFTPYKGVDVLCLYHRYLQPTRIKIFAINDNASGQFEQF
jgi:hypothetical protein